MNTTSAGRFPSIPFVNGVDQTIGVSKMRGEGKRNDKEQDRFNQWPYDYAYPQPNGDNASPIVGSIPAPQNGVQAEILRYTVPTGMRFFLRSIIQQFAGTGFVQGSGAAIWTLDVNSPVSAGSQVIQSSAVGFFQSLRITLGSFDSGPFELGKPLIFEATTVIRSKVTTAAAITPGAPNFFTTVLVGWTVPAE